MQKLVCSNPMTGFYLIVCWLAFGMNVIMVYMMRDNNSTLHPVPLTDHLGHMTMHIKNLCEWFTNIGMCSSGRAFKRGRKVVCKKSEIILIAACAAAYWRKIVLFTIAKRVF